MGDSIKRFKSNLVIFFVLASFPASRCIITSTACYGSLGPSCLTHRLSCPSPLVIQIINTSYGYRAGCNNILGISGCAKTTCCDEQPGDCFKPLSSEEDQRVVGNCSRLETCEIRGLRRYDITDTVCNGRVVSAYSKIQYDCVSNGTTIAQTTVKSTSEVTQTPEKEPSTTQFSTDLTMSTSSALQCPQFHVAQNDNSGIVGGVLGTLLIISVIINVGLVVYITRKMKSLSSTTRENNYDGITNTGRDQTPNTYDALQVQSAASSDHDDKKISDSNHTYYNTKGESLSRDFNPYYENMKRP